MRKNQRTGDFILDRGSVVMDMPKRDMNAENLE